jgi:hypothetical protein
MNDTLENKAKARELDKAHKEQQGKKNETQPAKQRIRASRSNQANTQERIVGARPRGKNNSKQSN